MTSRYRWLKATIEFCSTNDLEMPWLALKARSRGHTLRAIRES